MKNLHLLLKLDLLLSLIVGILGSQLLELGGVVLIVVRPSAHALLFKLLVLSKKSLDLILVSLDDLVTLSLELLLDLLKLLMIIGSHIKELLTHSLNQIINIIILLFKRLNVFFILLL